MERQGLAARRAATGLLDQVLGQNRLMAEALVSGALDGLSPADRARAQRLAQDTLRGLERADRILKPHLRKAPPLPVRNVLRLAATELAGGAAAHGVVDAAVALVGEMRRHGHLKSLVNAVLRKTAPTAAEDWARLRVPRLPKWLRGPLVEAWGAPAVAAMERAHFAGAPLDLTARDDPAALAERLGGRLLPTGSVRLDAPVQVSALPGFDEGAFWVQDAAAALPVRLLDPQPGESVADLCAAPGGKTLQLAAAGAQVTALDVSQPRMERLVQNLARTGLRAQTVIGDALSHEGRHDAILLDAPCSATGTIRRHPDLPHARDGSEFAALIELQSRMIDAAWTMLRPGGRLVFCTCSLLPDEGEVQAEAALGRLPGAVPDLEAAAALPGVDPSWIGPEGGLRLRPDHWPDAGGMDGFYMIRLRKEA